MRIWFLGDSIIRTAVETKAAALGAELIDSSAESPSFTEVLINQTFDRRMRRYFGDCTVVLFVNQADYDSEGVINRILARVPNAAVVLLVYPEDARAAEGIDHWEGEKYKLGRLDALDEETVTLTLNNLLT